MVYQSEQGKSLYFIYILSILKTKSFLRMYYKKEMIKDGTQVYWIYYIELGRLMEHVRASVLQ